MLMAQLIRPEELAALTDRQREVLHATLAAEIASHPVVHAQLAAKIAEVRKTLKSSSRARVANLMAE